MNKGQLPLWATLGSVPFLSGQALEVRHPASPLGSYSRTLAAAAHGRIAGVTAPPRVLAGLTGPGHLRQRAFCYWVRPLGSGTLPFLWVLAFVPASAG
ncbi:hypothetical protein B0537_11475 [Desulforamulus ferrireducens]|uniref:Uncharacterized protein n=1 Tax=Desulforamulus ferrireducens TaxID=1833852 RepID=A0A1S6IXZ1_9FIRM|nr:hypothetical protein B0537_11475 [Desulforamulus ferrireducens]